MPKFKKLWRCGECREIHDDRNGASECCQPNITELFECAGCGGVHDLEGEAVGCCGSEAIRCPNCSRDYRQLHINAHAIVTAGHCTACNPIFTLDQRLQIEDLHRQHTGELEDLRLGHQ